MRRNTTKLAVYQGEWDGRCRSTSPSNDHKVLLINGKKSMVANLCYNQIFDSDGQCPGKLVGIGFDGRGDHYSWSPNDEFKTSYRDQLVSCGFAPVFFPEHVT